MINRAWLTHKTSRMKRKIKTEAQNKKNENLAKSETQNNKTESKIKNLKINYSESISAIWSWLQDDSVLLGRQFY